MDALTQVLTNTNPSIMVRTVSESVNPGVLGDIYQDLYNIAIWRRTLPKELVVGVDALLKSRVPLQLAMNVTPQNVLASVQEKLQGYPCALEISQDIARLVDMFCCLFDLDSAGLRLTALDHAMCPRFHVDRVPCRLVTTYQGTATQWLPHQLVDRSKLGAGNNGLADELSGIYQSTDNIQQLDCGDVALIKGELWEGNEHAGLVHRSPHPRAGEKRLLMTLDFL